jgi:hypothetical protein
MKPIRLALITTAIILLLAGLSHADWQEKRHQIGLHLGMWSQITNTRTEVGIGTVSTSVGSDGFLGGVYYSHWLSEGLAISLEASAMALDVDTRIDPLTVSTVSSSVTRALIGARLYFPKSTYGTSVRPFVSATVGPYFGDQSETTTGLTILTESRTETAFGGQLGAGVDFILGRHFLTGVTMGYQIMSDFDNPIGGSNNYGGPVFGISIAYLFGKGLQ